MRWLACGLLLLLVATPLAADRAVPFRLVWPTPNEAWVRGEPLEAYIQDTGSGEVSSGLFGCVRNDGRRFHEAIDLKATRHDRRGEATDPVFAALPGVVVHVSATAGHSSYGRYVVLEHPDYQPVVYTLYSHLRSIDGAVRPGVRVPAGAELGIMGRSAAGYHIPKARAHLHFEIGFRLSDDFQHWFDAQEFGSPNRHGNFNGMNLVGLDPLGFYNRYRRGEADGLAGLLAGETVTYRVRVATGRVPWFIRRNPALAVGGHVPSVVVGWEIDFTGFGLPLRWRPLEQPAQLEGLRPGHTRVLGWSPSAYAPYACRDALETDGREARLGPHGRQMLALLFGVEFQR